MQEIIDKLIASNNRFRMELLYDEVWSMFSSDEAIVDSLNILNQKLKPKECKKLAYGILRHAFLIELVKLPKVETTKFCTRWDSQLSQDSRNCSFLECKDIAHDLILNFANNWLNNTKTLEVLNLFFDYAILPYELPIDYIERPLTSSLALR